MLDNLKTGLRAAIKKIVSSTGVDEEMIKQLANDVLKSLLSADVKTTLAIQIA